MSIEILGRLFGAVERADLDAYLACFNEGAEYRAANYPAVYGKEAIREFAMKMAPYFEKVAHTVKDSWQIGETIVAEMELVYYRRDGKVITVPCVDIIQLENGKVKSLHAYLDAAPAFA